MKKLLYCAAALATLLFAGSCQRENLEPAVEGTTVTYTVSVPGVMATKASSYTGVVDSLVYEVHGANGRLYKNNAMFTNGVATLDIEVVKDQNFTILFWAQKKGVAFDTESLEEVKMPTTFTANVEDYEAFYGVDEFVYANDIALTNTVELTRAVSMLNIGTTAASLNVGGERGNVELLKSAVSLELPNTLNVMTGDATTDPTPATPAAYAENDVPSGQLTVGTGSYEYVAKNYVGFADKNKSIADVTLTILTDEGTITHEIPSVPFQRNYKTNIVGDLITAKANYNVTLGAWETEETNVEIWDGETIKEPAYDEATKTYSISSGSELAYIAQLVNGTLDTDNVTRAAVAANSLKGYTVKLVNNIALGDMEWTPIGNGSNHFMGTFDGNNKTIYGLKVTKRRDDRAALFGTVSGTITFRNLTINGAEVRCPDFDGDFYGSALIGTAYGVVTIENVDVVDSYISGNNKVGALLAHDGVMNVFTVSGCDVSGTTFEALNTEDGGSVGGLVGYFQTGKEHYISNNSVKGCTFNVVNSSNTGKRANGLLFGGIDSKAGQKLYINNYVIENNTWNEKFYVNGVEVTEEEDKFLSPYDRLIGGERNDKAEGELYINDELFVLPVSTTEELNAALEEGATVKAGKGNFTLTSFPAGATIIGVGNSTVLNATNIITVNGAVNIENARVVMSNDGYKGFQGNPELYFKNCTIEGQPFLYGAKATFEDCTFEQSVKDNYNVWVYAVKEANFIDCVFNCDGRCVLIYQEGPELVQNVAFEGCTFNAATPANSGKAAVEIGASNLTTGLYTVTIDGCEANGFDNGSVSGNTLWNVKNGDRASVTVDGEVAFLAGADLVSNGLWKSGTTYSVTNAEGLASINSMMANNAAGTDITINLLSDIDFTGKTWTPVRSHIDWKSTMNEFNGNGHTISNLTINGQAMFTIFANSHDVVVKDVTFDNANVTCNGLNSAIIVGQTYNNLLLDNVDVKSSAVTGGYKVATLVGTVYNEATSTITATLKNCDVTDTTVKSTSYDFCTTGMVAFVYAEDNDKIEFENCTVSDVNLYGPNNGYTAHAAIYTTGSENLFDEAEGVTVTNVTFENI